MIRFILWVFSIMSLRLNHFMGTLIGQYLYLTQSDSRAVVSKNIQLCFPKLNLKQQQTLVKKSLIESGKGLSESGFIWFRGFDDNAKYVTKTIGMEHLKSDKAVILLVPHFGCWELVARMVSLSEPVVFMYKTLKDKQQNALLLSKREQGDLLMAPANKKGVIKLQRAINNKQLIAILPDQDPGEVGSVLVPFFSQNARTMTLLARLARKNNAQVVMAWAKRLPSAKGYELNFKPIKILSNTNTLEDDVSLMNKAIEDLVTTQPEQYLWNYKRFKSLVKY
ncbi:lipid A biosynthesis lauroyl acyltransferase [Isorropodon fossajaponicum endosymbiont JTNG4]|uniref:lysophospholipid acyltransferase family protein n=1 Tax=Isorropodon fossajaponicum symbiont TaxID=883811 RepID=UPI001916BDBB|nr:lysophospholipid acyltransferase family protein [Isorropodon fossajaponicum symbiont]BBB23606.1 lipid A biosynthesis lauroyl acyltransferase [Isorropodon fossajaponicum endosymbiont JTNG4]